MDRFLQDVKWFFHFHAIIDGRAKNIKWLHGIQRDWDKMLKRGDKEGSGSVTVAYISLHLYEV